MQLKDEAIQAIEHEIALWHPKETGGILVGRYDPSYRLAIVEIATASPSDSTHGLTDFVRGEFGIADLLGVYKKQSTPLIYLGEWHSHPNHAPNASLTDVWQMNNFASRHLYGAKSPLLLIVGGSLSIGLKWKASIHKKWKKPLYLLHLKQNT